MSLVVACPKCQKRLKVADTVRGKKIKCPACTTVISIPLQPTAAKVAQDEEVGPRVTPRAAGKAAPRTRSDQEDDSPRPAKAIRSRAKDDEEGAEVDDRPRKRVKKGSSRGTIILVVVGIVLLVCVGGAAGIYYFVNQAGEAASRELAELDRRNKERHAQEERDRLKKEQEERDRKSHESPTGDPNPPGGDPKQVEPSVSIVTDIEGGTTGVAVSSDGKLIITEGYGKTKNVQIWDVQKQQKLQEFDVKNGSVAPVAIAPNGKLAAYSADYNLMLYDAASGKQPRELRPNNHGLEFVHGLQFSPAGDLLIVGSGKYLVGWDPATGKERFDWQVSDKRLSSLSNLFDSGKKIVTGSDDGAVKVWDVATGQLLQTLAPGGTEKKVVSLSVSSDGKTLIAISLSGPAQVWDLSTGQVRKTLKDLNGWVHVRFLPNSQTIAYTTAPYEKKNPSCIILQDLETGARTHVLKGHTKELWSLAVTPDGATLVSGGEDKTVKVWDLKALP